ncbi:hypothetical protein [Pseudomonas sp. Marseille-Q5115]|nr:hypothetical protein [Pseudomonas sp. Marseille-Q5115]
MRSLFDLPPELTDAQVAALAKRGESWEEARERRAVVYLRGSVLPVPEVQ